MENPQRLNVQSREKSLKPDWISGFVDGEGCFFVGINPHPEMTAGYQVLPEFTVVQHVRDIQILHAFKKFFGCGVVRENHGDRLAYCVRSLEHLKRKIVPFFESHPLRTKKWIDFLKFRKILLLMEKSEHLDPQGVERIQEIAKTMNRGAGKIKSSPSGNGEGNN